MLTFLAHLPGDLPHPNLLGLLLVPVGLLLPVVILFVYLPSSQLAFICILFHFSGSSWLECLSLSGLPVLLAAAPAWPDYV